MLFFGVLSSHCGDALQTLVDKCSNLPQALEDTHAELETCKAERNSYREEATRLAELVSNLESDRAERYKKMDDTVR